MKKAKITKVIERVFTESVEMEVTLPLYTRRIELAWRVYKRLYSEGDDIREDVVRFYNEDPHWIAFSFKAEPIPHDAEIVDFKTYADALGKVLTLAENSLIADEKQEQIEPKFRVISEGHIAPRKEGQ